MSKISVALRGWRFEESEVFDADGEMRDLGEMPEDTRNRLVRLSALMGEPCTACWLEHGESDIERANQGEIVYGEPLAEVLLCAEHEPDFLYWFREAGGEAHAGGAALQEEFQNWYAAGNRAPEGYAGLEHVEREPDRLPDASEDQRLEAVEQQAADLAEEEREALGLDLDDLDV
jgi:hypothetical protein